MFVLVPGAASGAGLAPGGGRLGSRSRRTMCFQTVSTISQVPRGPLDGGGTASGGSDGWVRRTFSNPKNLSVPSVLTGPAFCSIFSRGVSSGGGSSFSFFLLAESFAVAVGVPWVASASVSRHGGGHASSREGHAIRERGGMTLRAGSRRPEGHGKAGVGRAERGGGDSYGPVGLGPFEEGHVCVYSPARGRLGGRTGWCGGSEVRSCRVVSSTRKGTANREAPQRQRRGANAIMWSRILCASNRCIVKMSRPNSGEQWSNGRGSGSVVTSPVGEQGWF